VRIIRWLIAALVALLLVVFAISNRQTVEVTFWPFPVIIDSALSLIVLGAIVLAFLVGQFLAWLGAQRWRHEARAKQRRIEALERELAATQAQLTSVDELAGLRRDSKPRG
jgi:lipopolysaccharide assembly protein A